MGLDLATTFYTLVTLGIGAMMVMVMLVPNILFLLGLLVVITGAWRAEGAGIGLLVVVLIFGGLVIHSRPSRTYWLLAIPITGALIGVGLTYLSFGLGLAVLATVLIFGSPFVSRYVESEL
jgi:hypothetical protein